MPRSHASWECKTLRKESAPCHVEIDSLIGQEANTSARSSHALMHLATKKENQREAAGIRVGLNCKMIIELVEIDVFAKSLRPR